MAEVGLQRRKGFGLDLDLDLLGGLQRERRYQKEPEVNQSLSHLGFQFLKVQEHLLIPSEQAHL